MAAGFQTRSFLEHDDYMTPKSAWENIKHLIPKNKVLWEAFYGDGKSGTYLKELGFETIHEPVDFFENNLGDVIVSNPPFSKVKDIMKRLLALDKPFILIFPISKINTSYFREWKDKGLQIIIPRKRIHFQKYIDGEPIKGWKSTCSFDCLYYCYKIGLPRDIIWLE
jgi:hypothetical protein